MTNININEITNQKQETSQQMSINSRKHAKKPSLPYPNTHNNFNSTKPYVQKFFCEFLISIISNPKSLYYCRNEFVDCLVWTLRQRWVLPPLLSSPCKPFLNAKLTQTKSILISMNSNRPCSFSNNINK